MTHPNPPIDLRCLYFHNPLGIDDPQPRLSWRMDDNRRGAAQRAYRIIVSSSIDALTAGDGDLWDSGRVDSPRTTHIPYAGKQLASRQRVWWKVCLWDQDNRPSGWSQPAWWEMGLLERNLWQGQWIGAAFTGGPRTVPPAPYLRRTFDLPAGIRSARLYVTALGLYECEINGRRVGDDVFTPGRTEYSRRVQYQTYDVTDLLLPGKANAIGAILGDGWYCGHVHSDPRQRDGDRPRFLAQLMVTLADKSDLVIATDSAWRWATGPIRSSDLLMGEDYDARLEMPGWSTAAFDDAAWQPVVVFDDPGIELVASRSPRVRRIQELRPIAPPTMPKNRKRWIYDFGQNMVGRVRLKVRGGKPGTTIGIRHAEMLDAKGQLYTEALRSARATDYYTIRGDGSEEIYEPRFTFHGFRYIEVHNHPGDPNDLDIVTGVVLHTDLELTGEFECSDPLVNRLQQNIVWSQKGNFLEIPTDCPQRDERLGWTGDAQVFCRTASFNMNVAGFFHKWLLDMADAQNPDGSIPSVVPHCPSIHKEGGPAWADAAVICPWTIYLCYGDRQILEDRYPMMQRFIGFLRETCPNHIRADASCKWRGYGDWLSINAETPKDLIGTAFYAHCADLMSRIATILGRTEDAKAYRQLFEEVREAWNRHYVTPDGLIVAQTQTAYVLALQFDLLPAELRPRVAAALVRDIRERGMHLSTGFVGTPYLNHVLTEMGYLDVAYALLLQKTYPSWLYPVTQGATTMWERWDAWTHDKGFNDAGMNSYNHYAYGAVGHWLYAVVAGIDLDPDQPGYSRIRFAPRPGGGLTHARASLRSMHGLIESAWRIEGDRLIAKLTVPPNTTATLRLPTADASAITESARPAAQAQGVKLTGTADGIAVFDLAAGHYEFATPWNL